MSETTQQPEPRAGTVRKRGRPPKANGTGSDKPQRIRRTRAQIEAANAAANAAANSAPASNMPLITKSAALSQLSRSAAKDVGAAKHWPSVVIDQEVAAITQIIAAIDSCPGRAKSRILHYLAHRYADLEVVPGGA